VIVFAVVFELAELAELAELDEHVANRK